MTLWGCPIRVIYMAKLVWRELNMVATDNWKKKCANLQRIWVGKRTVILKHRLQRAWWNNMANFWNSSKCKWWMTIGQIRVEGRWELGQKWFYSRTWRKTSDHTWTYFSSKIFTKGTGEFVHVFGWDDGWDFALFWRNGILTRVKKHAHIGCVNILTATSRSAPASCPYRLLYKPEN